MENIFTKEVVAKVIARINNLTYESSPNWGIMSVDKMLAHLCVQYDMVYTDKIKKPSRIMRFILASFIKKSVVSEKAYPKNIRTAPQFIISDQRDFEAEKKRLIDYIKKTQELGEDYFEGKESQSFGKLKKHEWNNLFYKHIDHHLNQFGV